MSLVRSVETNTVQGRYDGSTGSCSRVAPEAAAAMDFGAPQLADGAMVAAPAFEMSL